MTTLRWSLVMQKAYDHFNSREDLSFMNKKILLTGFKPFLNEPINPSEILANKMAEIFPDLSVLTLPVSYENSFAQLKKYWQSQGPFDGLVMLGQAGGRNSVCLERVAVNWCETSYADEDGVNLPVGPLLANAPSSYISSFFNSQWIDELSKIGPTAVSFSAGTYVCNSLYYRALHELTKNQKPTLFVHVPYLPEQTKDKPQMPSMDLSTQQNIIKKIIELMK